MVKLRYINSHIRDTQISTYPPPPLVFSNDVAESRADIEDICSTAQHILRKLARICTRVKETLSQDDSGVDIDVQAVSFKPYVTVRERYVRMINFLHFIVSFLR